MYSPLIRIQNRISRIRIWNRTRTQIVCFFKKYLHQRIQVLELMFFSRGGGDGWIRARTLKNADPILTVHHGHRHIREGERERNKIHVSNQFYSKSRVGCVLHRNYAGRFLFAAYHTGRVIVLTLIVLGEGGGESTYTTRRKI